MHKAQKIVDHIILGCPIILNTEHLQKNDFIAKCINWTLCKHNEIPHSYKWYKHTPEPVVEGKNIMVIWDFIAYMDRKIDANQPDIIIKDFKERICTMLDVITPANENISLKELDMFWKYK